MTAKALMLQGTGSDVGKSVLVAGLCRVFTRRGLKVRPFKPQNMSNNAAVTTDGGEIGRAQALQARACGVAPTTDMNPVLLKPQSDKGAQLVVHGKVVGDAAAAPYQRRKGELLGAVLESYQRLSAEADLIVVEGAGSPAEVNLRAGDIANMGFARAADVPVVLVGDIDRGGVIAALVGTCNIIDDADRAMVKGFIINKFRGDIRLFDDGLTFIEKHTGWPGFGVVPWVAEVARLPAEDAVTLEKRREAGTGVVRIAVPMLSRIANFDDFDPLKLEPDVSLEMIPPGRIIPADVDLIIVPGTKATLADLAFLRAQGWDVDILSHVRRGGRVLGICGGYQILGRTLADPGGVEGPAGQAAGLGLLNVATVLAGDKILTPASGVETVTGLPVRGYEMHIGRTAGPDSDSRPLLRLEEGRADGAMSPDGRVAGCYLHGLFADDAFRRAFLAGLGAADNGAFNYDQAVEEALDALAVKLEEVLDIDGLLALAR
jgi:adenosylcobyric acid synthase